MWTVDQLADFSDFIVSGQVATVSSSWDSSVASIYTFVSVDVEEVFKGIVDTPRLTVKQLGGTVGEIGLFIADQATFETGEHVLLFLERRPRDQTLYTAGLSQGKWRIVTLPTGDRFAVRGHETLSLASPTRTRPASRTPRLDARQGLSIAAVEGPTDGLGITSGVASESSRPVMLMSVPYLFTFFPSVDVQAGGQPGLPGGGFAEVQMALEHWNNTGASFRFLPGTQISVARCVEQFLGNYRVTISFMDPCGEISNRGGTLAIGGSYFSTTQGVSVSGRNFRLALEGFVINNDSAVALEFLTASGCFADVQLHELGHVLGLGHSTDNTAIMFPSLSTRCLTTSRGLAADDINGVQFIYPLASAGTPDQPSITRADAIGEFLTIQWTAAAGAMPTTHRLDFYSGEGLSVSVTVGAVTSVVLPIPTGTTGAFSVRVTPFAGATPGPASNAFLFTVGGACTGPPGSPVVTGAVVSGTATVNWSVVPGATNYIIQAGSTTGAFDLFPPTSVGSSTGAGAGGLPPGFTAWVRVTAINACGPGGHTDFLLH